MPVEPELLELVERVATYHITHRATKEAQRRMESAIRSESVDETSRAEYFKAIRRYFEGFDQEARAHLRDVDRRLEHINQVHFNLTAERGVAVKRIEGTRGVLDTLAQLEATAR